MITAKTGTEATARPGGRGQFDVLADGDLIWSKHEIGRFPEDDEILRRLA